MSFSQSTTPKLAVNTYSHGVLGNHDATAIAEMIKKGEISAQEAVSCAIERAKSSHEALNAIVSDRFESSLQEASEPLQNGVFAGVPTFIKDLNDFKGLPTRMGCKGVSNKPVKEHDEVVRQILSVTGAVVLGKSTTSEFGFLPCGETLFGDTHNPWNTAYSTGGSSAGSAALVAAGVVPFAHASDGGGSIRIPASCNGLVGLKPSRKRNVTSMTASLVPINIAEDGILSRSVRDTANYYAGLERYHREKSLPPIGHVQGPGKKRLKIALFTESPAGIESHDSVKDAVIKTGQILEKTGHQITYISSPFRHEFSRDFIFYWSYLAFMNHLGELIKKGTGYNPLKVTRFTRELSGIFPFLSPGTGAALSRLRKFEQYYYKQFDQYDVLLSPVLSHPPPKLGHFGPHVNGIDILMRLNAYINFTPVQNITGAPAISLPMGFSREGLPIGVQLAAENGAERKLLELAFEIEAEGGFASTPFFR
jgi:amidase